MRERERERQRQRDVTYTKRLLYHVQRSFNEMQTWITELRQLGPQNLVLAITGNKLDLESARQVRVQCTCVQHYMIHVHVHACA